MVAENGGECGLLDDAPGVSLPNRAPCTDDIFPDGDRWAKLLDDAPLLSPETA